MLIEREEQRPGVAGGVPPGDNPDNPAGFLGSRGTRRAPLPPDPYHSHPESNTTQEALGMGSQRSLTIPNTPAARSGWMAHRALWSL